MDSGIFKLKPCGFVGRQRATREWLEAAYQRAEQIEKALRVPKKKTQQLRLPGVK